MNGNPNRDAHERQDSFAIVQAHRKAKREILCVLRDSAGRTAPEAVLVSWMAEQASPLSREAVEALTAVLENLALLRRRSTDYGDVLTLTHFGEEIANGVLRIPSIDAPPMPEQAATEREVELPSLQSLVAELHRAATHPRWYWTLVFLFALALMFIVLGALWSSNRLLDASHLLLILCPLSIAVFEMARQLPAIVRPVRAIARQLDDLRPREDVLIERLSECRLRDLERLDARVSVDLEMRKDRQQLLGWGASGMALALAVTAGLFGLPADHGVLKDLGLWLGAFVLGLYIGAAVGVMATGRLRRVKFVLTQAMAVRKSGARIA